MNKEIDKLFKDKLTSYTSPVDGEVWNGISTQMASSKSLKNRLWFLFAILFVVTTGILAYFLVQSSHNNGADRKETPGQLASLPHIVKGDIIVKDDIEFPDSKSSLIAPLVGNMTSDELNHIEKRSTNFSIASVNKSISFSPGHYEGSSTLILEEELQNNSTDPILKSDFSSGVMTSSRKLLAVDELPGLEIASINDRNTIGIPLTSLGECFEGPPNRFMVGINGSLDYPFRSMRLAGSNELYDYLDQRKATESSLPSFTAGLQFGYFHGSGLLVRSGFQYTQINDRFLQVKENVIKIQTQITIDTMYNPDGSYSIHKDTSILEVLGVEELKTINQFRMFDIPVIFGYRIHTDRFQYEISAGMIFNISSQTSGRILNEQLIPNYYGTKGNTDFAPYKRQFGTSLYGGVTILTTIFGKTQLYIEPNARYYLKSFSNQSYPIRDKYFVVGLSGGLRYYF